MPEIWGQHVTVEHRKGRKYPWSVRINDRYLMRDKRQGWLFSFATEEEALAVTKTALEQRLLENVRPLATAIVLAGAAAHWRTVIPDELREQREKDYEAVSVALDAAEQAGIPRKIGEAVEEFERRSGAYLYETRSNEAKRLIETALETTPYLTSAGIGLERSKVEQHGGDHKAALAAERSRLRTHPAFVGQVQRSADWIKQQRPLKGFNTRHTSYGYKHMVERWWKQDYEAFSGPDAYVANGAFIAAAVGLGWAMKQNGYSLNVHFKFSQKRLREVETTRPARYL